ncbi:MAG: DJ-1/PfpI family protein [Treponema sp.]|nr:DJ-1/PfpI family protein [Treponema sp.]
MKKVIVLLADGFEEVEAITPADYLRRAGAEVTIVSISESLSVTGRWTGIKVIADTTLKEFLKQGSGDWDAVILPGGMPGAANLSASAETGALLKTMAANRKVIAAICASPAVVLAPLELLAGKKFTCYPGLEKKAAEAGASVWSEDRVVTDGDIITSRGAGTAGEWSVAIIEKLFDKETAEKIAEAVLL